MDQQHKTPLLICPLCQRGFPQSSSLKRHVQKVHGEGSKNNAGSNAQVSTSQNLFFFFITDDPANHVKVFIPGEPLWHRLKFAGSCGALNGAPLMALSQNLTLAEKARQG